MCRLFMNFLELECFLLLTKSDAISLCLFVSYPECIFLIMPQLSMKSFLFSFSMHGNPFGPTVNVFFIDCLRNLLHLNASCS